MDTIYACELNRVNPFDYLTELELHAEELESHPEHWMPWNYRSKLERIQADRAHWIGESPDSPHADPALEPAGQR